MVKMAAASLANMAHKPIITGCCWWFEMENANELTAWMAAQDAMFREALSMVTGLGLAAGAWSRDEAAAGMDAIAAKLRERAERPATPGSAPFLLAYADDAAKRAAALR